MLQGPCGKNGMGHALAMTAPAREEHLVGKCLAYQMC